MARTNTVLWLILLPVACELKYIDVHVCALISMLGRCCLPRDTIPRCALIEPYRYPGGTFYTYFLCVNHRIQVFCMFVLAATRVHVVLRPLVSCRKYMLHSIFLFPLTYVLQGLLIHFSSIWIIIIRVININ